MWFRITRNMGYLSANCGITECQCSSKCGLTANFLQRPIMPSLFNTNNPALGLSSFQGSQKGLRCFPMRCWDTVRFHLLVFSAILKPKANEESQGDLLWQLKMNQCVQHEQSCPISLSLSTLDLIEMVTSGLLVAARNLCVCEHKHSAFKKENGNKELLNRNQIPVKTCESHHVLLIAPPQACWKLFLLACFLHWYILFVWHQAAFCHWICITVRKRRGEIKRKIKVTLKSDF